MVKLIHKVNILILGLGLFVFVCTGYTAEVLSWQDCVKETLVNNPDLIAAKEQVVQSVQDKNISVSNVLPDISAQLGAKRSESAGASEVNSFSYSVTGQQVLFDGFKSKLDIDSAGKTLTAAEYNYLVVSSNIRLNLKAAFSALLRAQELISLTEEISKRREQNLELVRARYEAGREHKGAVLTAEADAAQAEFEVAQAKRNLALVQQELTRILGRDKKTFIKVSGSFDIEEVVDANPNFEVLADDTAFLKELIAKKEAARFNYDAKKAEFFPTVYLNSSVSKTRSKWPVGDNDWSAGVTVSVPIFEGGNKISQTKKAQSQLQEALANERSGRDSVIYILEKTWKDFKDAIGLLIVKEKFLKAARERAMIANAQYSSGLVSFDDWVIIEDNLVSAKKSYLDTQENLLLAQSYWIQAKGGTLDYAKE